MALSLPLSGEHCVGKVQRQGEIRRVKRRVGWARVRNQRSIVEAIIVASRVRRERGKEAHDLCDLWGVWRGWKGRGGRRALYEVVEHSNGVN